MPALTCCAPAVTEPSTPPITLSPSATTRRVLVTGGAGFIGASLALGLARGHPDWEVVALDNLSRRGSELNLPRLREANVRFIHGDVRNLEDLLAVGEIDALLECSAEPSVLAGIDGSPDYLVHTNLFGAYNCLELARRTHAQFLFLSTSRVYPVATLQHLHVSEKETRLALNDDQSVPGACSQGIAESFPMEGARTLYGATKLAAELLIGEYAETYGLDAVINRCGVVAGPWQMGKVDQGVFTFWMLAHHFNRPLSYIGFGGSGCCNLMWFYAFSFGPENLHVYPEWEVTFNTWPHYGMESLLDGKGGWCITIGEKWQEIWACYDGMETYSQDLEVGMGAADEQEPSNSGKDLVNARHLNGNYYNWNFAEKYKSTSSLCYSHYGTAPGDINYWTC